VLILADDLSGAADCAVACAEVGLDTMVLLDAMEGCGNATALAVDLDSRDLAPAEARALTYAAATRLAGPATLLYKKIDSTLRGNPAVEIAAARDTMAANALAIVAPAYPAMGRVTQGGRVFVHGVALENTETWRQSGATSPDLVAMLAGAGLQTRSLSLEAVRSEHLAEWMLRAVAGGNAALLCDAETDDDLAAIATAGNALTMPYGYGAEDGRWHAVTKDFEFVSLACAQN
jgi:uncharacterized protein YgbK (DUF1537 family)